MNRTQILVLNLILISVGAVTVYFFPWNPLAITLGMFLLAVSILSIALQIYFPPEPKHVILKVVEPVKTGRTVKKRRKVKAKRRKR